MRPDGGSARSEAQHPAGPPPAVEPLFEQVGEAYRPSVHTRGPWDAGAQHGGAPAALLAREIERIGPGADMFVARVTYEFLGPVGLVPLVAKARVIKPGRRLQVVEAELSGADGPLVLARAVRLRRGAVDLPDAALAGGAGEFPPPEAAAAAPFPPQTGEQGFHRTGMDIRWVSGSYGEPGPATAWFRFAHPLVAGELPSPLQRAVAAADFGNGVSRVLDFASHLFVNTDLTVQLHREVAGEWVLLDSRTVADTGGAGLASSALHDQRGPVGLATQTLFVDTR